MVSRASSAAAPPRSRTRGVRVLVVSAGLALAATGALGVASAAGPAAADQSSPRIVGAGSSWAANAVLAWQAALRDRGTTVDYLPNGSSTGRRDFAEGATDFAVSEIPYDGPTRDPQDSVTPSFDYAQFPVAAGGTAFAYNLPVGGKSYRALKLSQPALAGIFSGRITSWNDPAIAATNPHVALPDQTITVVVRSDGAGVTALLTSWMLRQFPDDYAALCATTGCDPRVPTSYFPDRGLPDFTGQSGSSGVTADTAQTPYSIDYDGLSSALDAGLPVARVENGAGFFVAPKAPAVAVALTQAEVDLDRSSPDYLTQDLSRVYTYRDPRTYPLSAYTSMFVPTQTEGSFDAGQGATLGAFSTYSLCAGQQHLGRAGFSPLPMNLVLAGLSQVRAVPGVDAGTRHHIAEVRAAVRAGSANPCGNPAYQPGESPSHNALVDRAPFPARCDEACRSPWTPGD